jgi:hypothetical protein
MKVWPIDPLVPRSLRLEVPEKLPQGLKLVVPPSDLCISQSRFAGYAPGSVDVV